MPRRCWRLSTPSPGRISVRHPQLVAGGLVAAALAEAAISAVNLAEVVTKLIDIGVPAQQAWSETANLVPVVIDFGPELANASARLRTATRQAGLSLGDRACLALAERLQQPVLTTDRAWRSLSIGLDIRLIR